jgi:hypothetical protein
MGKREIERGEREKGKVMDKSWDEVERGVCQCQRGRRM